ncbi:MAG: type II toxin-antitoxin system Phd/YefM family antitoxin [Thermodesulfobacteriota bacterium]
MPIVSKSRFKPQALKYFREIQENGQELVITHHGKPVLKIVRFQQEPEAILEELKDSVLQFDDPLEPVPLEDWEPLK